MVYTGSGAGTLKMAASSSRNYSVTIGLALCAFFFIHLVDARSTHLPCAIGCHCYQQDGLLAANCSSLSDIDNIAHSVQVLRVTDFNDHSSIKDDTFSSLTNLKRLYLTHLRLHKLYPGAFRGLNRLEILDLSHNRFAVPSELAKAINELTQLHRLLLRGNPLGNFPVLTLNKLSYLDIGASKIRTIPDDAMKNLKNLKHLKLDRNLLTETEAEWYPHSLISLDLSKNHIKHFTRLEFEHLSNLEHIEISGNPLHCSCETLKLRLDFIMDQNVLCVYPKELRGTDLFTLKKRELCATDFIPDDYKRSKRQANDEDDNDSYNYDYEDEDYDFGSFGKDSTENAKEDELSSEHATVDSEKDKESGSNENEKSNAPESEHHAPESHDSAGDVTPESNKEKEVSSDEMEENNSETAKENQDEDEKQAQESENDEEVKNTEVSAHPEETPKSVEDVDVSETLNEDHEEAQESGKDEQVKNADETLEKETAPETPEEKHDEPKPAQDGQISSEHVPETEVEHAPVGVAETEDNEDGEFKQGQPDADSEITEPHSISEVKLSAEEAKQDVSPVDGSNVLDEEKANVDSSLTSHSTPEHNVGEDNEHEDETPNNEDEAKSEEHILSKEDTLGAVDDAESSETGHALENNPEDVNILKTKDTETSDPEILPRENISSGTEDKIDHKDTTLQHSNIEEVAKTVDDVSELVPPKSEDSDKMGEDKLVIEDDKSQKEGEESISSKLPVSSDDDDEYDDDDYNESSDTDDDDVSKTVDAEVGDLKEENDEKTAGSQETPVAEVNEENHEVHEHESAVAEANVAGHEVHEHETVAAEGNEEGHEVHEHETSEAEANVAGHEVHEHETSEAETNAEGHEVHEHETSEAETNAEGHEHETVVAEGNPEAHEVHEHETVAAEGNEEGHEVHEHETPVAEANAEGHEVHEHETLVAEGNAEGHEIHEHESPVTGANAEGHEDHEHEIPLAEGDVEHHETAVTDGHGLVAGDTDEHEKDLNTEDERGSESEDEDSVDSDSNADLDEDSWFKSEEDTDEYKDSVEVKETPSPTVESQTEKHEYSESRVHPKMFLNSQEDAGAKDDYDDEDEETSEEDSSKMASKEIGKEESPSTESAIISPDVHSESSEIDEGVSIEHPIFHSETGNETKTDDETAISPWDEEKLVGENSDVAHEDEIPLIVHHETDSEHAKNDSDLSILSHNVDLDISNYDEEKVTVVPLPPGEETNNNEGEEEASRGRDDASDWSSFAANGTVEIDRNDGVDNATEENLANRCSVAHDGHGGDGNCRHLSQQDALSENEEGSGEMAPKNSDTEQQETSTEESEGSGEGSAIFHLGPQSILNIPNANDLKTTEKDDELSTILPVILDNDSSLEISGDYEVSREEDYETPIILPPFESDHRNDTTLDQQSSTTTERVPVDEPIVPLVDVHDLDTAVEQQTTERVPVDEPIVPRVDVHDLDTAVEQQTTERVPVDEPIVPRIDVHDLDTAMEQQTTEGHDISIPVIAEDNTDIETAESSSVKTEDSSPGIIRSNNEAVGPTTDAAAVPKEETTQGAPEPKQEVEKNEGTGNETHGNIKDHSVNEAGIITLGTNGDEDQETASNSAGSYIVLGVIMGIIVVLLGYAVIRSRQKQTHSESKKDVENPGRELQDVSKPLLENKNNLAGNGIPADETQQPLMTKEEEAELSGKPHILNNGDLNTVKDTEVPEVIVENHEPKTETMQQNEDKVDGETLNGVVKEESILPLRHGPTTHLLASPTSVANGNGVPAAAPISPSSGRVRVVAKELPDSVAKRPVIIVNRGTDPTV